MTPIGIQIMDLGFGRGPLKVKTAYFHSLDDKNCKFLNQYTNNKQNLQSQYSAKNIT